jgi:hypothetical protein
VTIQEPDRPFFEWSFFDQNSCSVLEWLKQNGDHSITGPKIEFSASLDRLIIKKFFLTLLCIKRSRLADHLKTGPEIEWLK